jgi:hypothetical protein
VVTSDAGVEFHGGRVRVDLDDRHLAAVLVDVPVEAIGRGSFASTRRDEET